MSDFDATSFLETVFTEPSITEFLNCPAGEYPATVDKIEAREWTGKQDSSKSGVAVDVTWSIDSEEAKQACKRDKVTVRQSFMFSKNPDGMGIDMEKAKADVSFGKFRDALDLNGDKFAFSQANGRMARVRITHGTFTNKDGVSAVQANVAAVTKY